MAKESMKEQDHYRESSMYSKMADGQYAKYNSEYPKECNPDDKFPSDMMGEKRNLQAGP